jgi:hypothetical protein
MLGGNSIVPLDEVKGIRRVHCDITGIELLIEFNSVPDAYSFYKTVNGGAADQRFVTGGKFNCSYVKKEQMMIIRKVIDAEIDGVSVLLRTTEGSYEEALKDGFFTLDPVDTLQERSKTLCFGVNNNKACDAAESPIPIYENKYLGITCSNCFVGAKTTVFIDVKLSGFKLRHVGAGMRDMAINAAFVMDLKAQGSASGGIDKTFKVVDAGLVVQFWIGPVPVTIWYEIPLRIVANAAIKASATASAGAKASWKLGDAFVEWDERTGWKTAKPNPTFTWEPVLKGEANFNAEASLSVIPSFVIHVLSLIEAGVQIDPTLMAEAAGDTTKKELCLDLKYKVSAGIWAGVHINLPFVKLLEKKFGPYEVINTGEKPIGHWCVKA